MFFPQQTLNWASMKAGSLWFEQKVVGGGADEAIEQPGD